MDDSASPRDGNGRFAPGNPGGPGRSKGRGYELQHAAQEAITTHEMAVMMRKALKMGLEGNVAAMRFVAERTCGRPSEASIREPFDVELPPLRTIANCATAIDRLVEATLRGDVNDEEMPGASGKSYLLEVPAWWRWQLGRQRASVPFPHASDLTDGI